MKDKKTDTQPQQICFVIMPFSDPDGYPEGHFKKIYEQLFKPAIEAAGYKALRVDEDGNSSLIQAKIFERLINAPVVLCDLSTKNPNVLYELGIRHAFDKPVILVQEEGQTPIFDIAGVTTVFYRKGRLYDEVLEDQRKIQDAILQTVNAENQYSFMKLVSMGPAIVNSSGNISKEDGIYILLHEVLSKLGALENTVGKNNTVQTVFYSNMNEVLNRKRLMAAINKAEKVLFDIERGQNEFSRIDLIECEHELTSAINEMRNVEGIDADVIERAQYLRKKISTHLMRKKKAE